MPIYAGVAGAIRSVPSPLLGVNGSIRTASNCYVGVNGVTRPCFDPLAGVTGIEVIVSSVAVGNCTIDSNGNVHITSTIGTTMNTVNQYGSISASSNSLSISCSSYHIYMHVRAILYIRTNGNLETFFRFIHGNNLPFSITCDGDVRFSGYNNYYDNNFIGTDVVTGSVGASASNTVTITSLSNTDYDIRLEVAVGGNSAFSRQTYKNCVIGGRTFPITVGSLL